MRPSAARSALAQRVEPLVAHRVVVRASRRARAPPPAVELARHASGSIADRFVAADQIGVRIDQDHVVVAQASGAVQIEEHGAAAEERLDVAIERCGIETAQIRQELTFAAAHFSNGTGRLRRTGQLRLHIADCSRWGNESARLSDSPSCNSQSCHNRRIPFRPPPDAEGPGEQRGCAGIQRQRGRRRAATSVQPPS